MTFADSQKLSWGIHNAAAAKAKSVGACWRCCAEAGCRATDKAGLSRRTENKYEMHPMCAQRIGCAR